MGLQTEKEREIQKQYFKMYSKKFEKDELEVLKKIFKELGSRSGLNYIDKETFLQFFPLPGLWGERFFLKFNFKNTGYIDFEEFIIGIAICCRGTKSDKIHVLFDVFDLNGDGFIQKSEMVAMLSNIPYIHKLKDAFFSDENTRDMHYGHQEEDDGDIGANERNGESQSSVNDSGSENYYATDCSQCLREREEERRKCKGEGIEHLSTNQNSLSDKTMTRRKSDGGEDNISETREHGPGPVASDSINASTRQLNGSNGKNRKQENWKKNAFCRNDSGEDLYSSYNDSTSNSSFLDGRRFSNNVGNTSACSEPGSVDISGNELPEYILKNRYIYNAYASSTSYSSSSIDTSECFNSNDSRSSCGASESSYIDSDNTSDSFVSIYGYLIKNKKKKLRKKGKRRRKQINTRAAYDSHCDGVASVGGGSSIERISVDHIGRESERENRGERGKKGRERDAHVKKTNTRKDKKGRRDDGEEELYEFASVAEGAELKHERWKSRHRSRLRRERKKENKCRNLNDVCLPSKTARNILNDEEKNAEKEEKNVDVEAIVDKILEECEFLDNDKITLLQFKNIIYKYDFFLYIFFSCLHEDIWGLQGNVLYGRDYISNYIIKSDHFRSDSSEQHEGTITEELYFKIRQLFILQAPDYNCDNDSLCVDLMKGRNGKKYGKKIENEEGNEKCIGNENGNKNNSVVNRSNSVVDKSNSIVNKSNSVVNESGSANENAKKGAEGGINVSCTHMDTEKRTTTHKQETSCDNGHKSNTICPHVKVKCEHMKTGKTAKGEEVEEKGKQKNIEENGLICEMEKEKLKLKHGEQTQIIEETPISQNENETGIIKNGGDTVGKGLVKALTEEHTKVGKEEREKGNRNTSNKESISKVATNANQTKSDVLMSMKEISMSRETEKQLNDGNSKLKIGLLTHGKDKDIVLNETNLGMDFNELKKNDDLESAYSSSKDHGINILKSKCSESVSCLFSKSTAFCEEGNRCLNKMNGICSRSGSDRENVAEIEETGNGDGKITSVKLSEFINRNMWNVQNSEDISNISCNGYNDNGSIEMNTKKSNYTCDFNLLNSSFNDIFSKEIVEFIQASKNSFNINDVCKERSQHNRAKYKKARRNIEKVKNHQPLSFAHNQKKKKKTIERIFLDKKMKIEKRKMRKAMSRQSMKVLKGGKRGIQMIKSDTLFANVFNSTMTKEEVDGTESKKTVTEDEVGINTSKETTPLQVETPVGEGVEHVNDVGTNIGNEESKSVERRKSDHDTTQVNDSKEENFRNVISEKLLSTYGKIDAIKNLGSFGKLRKSNKKSKSKKDDSKEEDEVKKESDRNDRMGNMGNMKSMGEQKEDKREDVLLCDSREKDVEKEKIVGKKTANENNIEERSNKQKNREENNNNDNKIDEEKNNEEKKNKVVECERCKRKNQKENGKTSVSKSVSKSLSKTASKTTSSCDDSKIKEMEKVNYLKDNYLYSCPNCSSPFLMCPNCHGRYPRFCVHENKIAMKCEYCENCYFYDCIYCNFDFQKCLEMIKKNSIKEGTLYKIGKHLHQFKARYYVLFDNLLYYYDKKRNLRPRGFLFLEGCYVEVIPKNEHVSKYGFSICHRGMKKVQKRDLYVNSFEEREEWLQALYSSTKQNTLYNLYELHDQLGQGKFSTVYRGINKLTNSEFAIKVIDKRAVSIYEKELLRSEISILRLLRHPNVIYLKEIINTKENLYISMELVRGGELYDFLLAETRLSEMHANKIISQLIKTVAYLHRCGIIHRDIKPENILLTDKSRDAQIKLTDFGLSTLCAPNELLKEPCGTLAYVAPEVITLQGYNHKVDAWSIGIILYLILSGRLPFPINKNSELNINKNYVLHFRDPVWKNISSSAKDLITKLLQVDVEKRISVNEALEHIWIKNPTAVINENSVIYKNEEINILNLQDVSVSTFNIPKYVYEDREDNKPTNEESETKHNAIPFHRVYEKDVCSGNSDVGNEGDEPVIPLPYSGGPLKESSIDRKKNAEEEHIYAEEKKER